MAFGCIVGFLHAIFTVSRCPRIFSYLIRLESFELGNFVFNSVRMFSIIFCQTFSFATVTPKLSPSFCTAISITLIRWKTQAV
ncbi:MAG: DUF1564 family protein [Smithella sp.]